MAHFCVTAELLEFGSSGSGRKWHHASLEHCDGSIISVYAVQRLLDIQRETATSTGALAALGASLSLSILYSGSRGSRFFCLIGQLSDHLSSFNRYVAILRRYVPIIYFRANKRTNS